MYPILVSWGPIQIFSFSVFLIFAWLVFSFLFWKILRGGGVVEERIFDLTFYATLTSALGARLAFVTLHWELFSDTPLKIVAIWVQPGLSLYGGLITGLLTLIYLTRRYKIRLGLVLDALGLTIPAALLIGEIGSLLDGTQVGKITNSPWAMRYIGAVGRRHPVQLYEMISLIVILLAVIFWAKRSSQQKWPYGLVGIWFFALFAAFMFALEFFKDSSVYWNSLSANQWVLIAIFAEALGAFYVRGGGRERMRPYFARVREKLESVLKGVYAKFPQRRTHEH
ncbi:MAG: prolipoprotein diacylglyceryl transferase [Patescibacteria group bacterium]